MLPGGTRTVLAMCVSIGVLQTTLLKDSQAAGSLKGFEPDHPPALLVATGTGPRSKYYCRLDFNIDAFVGAYGTASEIGWEGNQQGVVTCLGGTFLVQDGMYNEYGFGIYNGAPTTWRDADGYLPAQITTFRHAGATVKITEFADKIEVGGDPYVAVYARVKITNATNHVVSADPEAAPGMVILKRAADSVEPHGSATHDYVVAADRFGADYAWPSSRALAADGGFEDHFAHMKHFWIQQLEQITAIDVPDVSLDNAYKSGFIYTQIARSGDQLHTGVNGYESEFSHDVVGILSNLFTQGYFSDAHALLLEARNVVGSQGQYVDGVWTYALPWAIYLMKTGDLSFVKANFDTEGPTGSAQPSIEDTAHAIASDRTGPSAIMQATDDIDTQGYWTIDDFEALLGLAAYRYLATSVGDDTEAAWASQQYDGLLSATNTALETTIADYHLDYLPCSIFEPNTADRCANPEDANWTSPFGNWAWEGYILGASRSGPAVSLIDQTYDYGFRRLRGRLPPDTFGGFPDDYYSSGYNAANASAGLASNEHRDQGILSYEFMIANSQSGPYSWWESSTAPSTRTPWVGRHPVAGQGSCPHAWGIAGANKALLDSVAAEKADGTLIVGRGVPRSWLHDGESISVTNFPGLAGRRLGLEIVSSATSVTLSLSGHFLSQRVLFELPAFIDNVKSTSVGRVTERSGTVSFTSRSRTVTVVLRRPLASRP